MLGIKITITQAVFRNSHDVSSHTTYHELTKPVWGLQTLRCLLYGNGKQLHGLSEEAGFLCVNSLNLLQISHSLLLYGINSYLMVTPVHAVINFTTEENTTHLGFFFLWNVHALN